MEQRIKEFFYYTILCGDCKKTSRVAKVDLSIFNDEDVCSLTELEKMEDRWRFYCIDCDLFNSINFDNFVNKTTILLLKKKVTLSWRLVTIAKEIDKIETDIEETLFLIEKNKYENDLIYSLSKIKL